MLDRVHGDGRKTSRRFRNPSRQSHPARGECDEHAARTVDRLEAHSPRRTTVAGNGPHGCRPRTARATRADMRDPLEEAAAWRSARTIARGDGTTGSRRATKLYGSRRGSCRAAPEAGAALERQCGRQAAAGRLHEGPKGASVGARRRRDRGISSRCAHQRPAGTTYARAGESPPDQHGNEDGGRASSTPSRISAR